LWQTHKVINEAVAKLEYVLLLCRGRQYYNSDEQLVTEDNVKKEAIEYFRSVQKQNAGKCVGTDQEILDKAKLLYEAIVPSVCLDDNGKPLDGDAQAAGGFAGPLMDRESSGFQNIFDKILSPAPAWIEQMDSHDENWQQASVAWLASQQAKQLLSATGAPSAWIKKLRAGQAWQEAFVADQKKKKEEVKGTPTLIRALKAELCVLPLLAPPVASQIAGFTGGLTPWDRLALRLGSVSKLVFS
jgi:hypothetical protein